MRSKGFLVLLGCFVASAMLADQKEPASASAQTVVTTKSKDSVMTSTMVDPKAITIPKGSKPRQYFELSKDLPLANNVLVLGPKRKAPSNYEISDVQIGKNDDEPIWIKLATPARWSKEMTEKILQTPAFDKFQQEVKKTDTSTVLCAPDAPRRCTKTCERDNGTSYCCEWSCQ
jgi:hypothetical protein